MEPIISPMKNFVVSVIAAAIIVTMLYLGLSVLAFLTGGTVTLAGMAMATSVFTLLEVIEER